MPSFPCSAETCSLAAPYHGWYCDRHAQEQICLRKETCNQEDDSFPCSNCYMHWIADRDRSLGHNPYDGNLQQRWICSCCNAQGQISAFWTMKYDADVLTATYRGYCENCTLALKQYLTRVYVTCISRFQPSSVICALHKLD